MMFKLKKIGGAGETSAENYLKNNGYRILDKNYRTPFGELDLVAFEDDELVGTVCLKTHDMDNKPDLSPWLAGLYVKESWRKKGVGSTLVKAIEQKAVELGINHLFLYTPESANFYSNLGWSVIKKENYHKVPVTIMEKNCSLTRASS